MDKANSVIYVVDDDASVLEALSSLVRSIGLQVRCFSSAHDFFDELDIRTHGCLILDVRMPEMSGLDVQKKLVDIGDTIPIIFISGHGDIPMAVKAIKAGAVDFLTKPFREEDLLSAIRTALEVDAIKTITSGQEDEIKARYDSLSLREKQVMFFVVQGYLNKNTAVELDVSEATIKVHRHNIMKKMQAGSVQELVRMSEKARLMDTDTLHS